MQFQMRIEKNRNGDTMITIVRSASIAPGKTEGAHAFARNITKHIEKKYGRKLQVVTPIGGNPNRIAWLGTYEDVAEWEDFTSKALADRRYMKLVAENGPNFIPGSVHDEIWRSVS